jgi:SAM-dependent methyltransferase
VNDAVTWHDVECGSYGADMPLWRELAERAGGPVLELGAGTGRVALDLAERGHEVTAVDVDGELLEELGRRAHAGAPQAAGRPAGHGAAQRSASGLPVELVRADARRLSLPARFALVLAPMQFLQIVGGAPGRTAVLGAVKRALLDGGLFAAALSELDDAVAPEDAEPPVPDVGEQGGWVYSSLPLDVRREPSGVAVERLRQLVSPRGELTEVRHTQLLDYVSAEQLEDELVAAGLAPVERREIVATADHVGSMVVICRR